MHYEVLHCASQMYVGKRSNSLGVFTAMSITQGGNGFPFLAECVYTYLCSGESTGIFVPTDKVPDQTLRLALEIYCFIMFA